MIHILQYLLCAKVLLSNLSTTTYAFTLPHQHQSLLQGYHHNNPKQIPTNLLLLQYSNKVNSNPFSNKRPRVERRKIHHYWATNISQEEASQQDQQTQKQYKIQQNNHDTIEWNENMNDMNNISEMDDENDVPMEEGLDKKDIQVSASIILPFSADVAFDAFADAPRQPSWSSWLYSVSYTDDDDDDGHNNDHKNDSHSTTTTTTAANTRMMDSEKALNRETKWVMGIKRLQYSWRSKVIYHSRPNRIDWKSVSGLRNRGIVQFEEYNNEKNGNNEDNDATLTKMRLTFTFTTPRAVALVLRRKKATQSFMENKILMPTLVNFRMIVATQDLGLDASALDSLPDANSTD